MIQTSDSSRIYIGNNSISVPYPAPFKFHADEDLVVVVRDVAGAEDIQILETDYTVIGAGDPNGGSIKTTWPVPETSHISIARVVPMTQLTSYEEGDSFPAKSHEKALDKLTMEVQQLARGMGTGTGGADDLGTAFRLTEASGGVNAVPRHNDTVLGLTSEGQAILRTPSEMLGWLGQVGTAWANDAERAHTRGSYAGQLGVQTDNWAIYVAASTAPGDWQPFLRFDGVVTSVDGVPGAKNNPDGDIVGTIESQVLYNKTLQTPTIIDPAGLDANDVGLGNVDNVADEDKPVSSETVLLLQGKQSIAEKGLSNGYASLDGSTKIPLSQLPDVILGASVYKGTWNASTNTPTIPAAGPTNLSWYYIVSVAGSTNINGITSWAVGDNLISNGIAWEKITSTSAVSSVNAKTGVVVLNKADVGLSKVENYNAAELAALPSTFTNKTIDGANNALTVRLGSDVTGNLPTTRLNSGTGAASNTWWCGDGSWKTPAGTGDMVGPPSSAESEVVLFSGTTGKLLKRATGSGLVNVSAGVYQAPASLTSLAPIGSILDFAGAAEPNGWLFCDGRSLWQTDYSDLYTVIGQQYGTGGSPVLVSEANASAFTGSSLTVSGLASTGENRLLLILVQAYATGDLVITGITFNGVALTRRLDWAQHTNLTMGEYSLWSLVNPPAVTGNVVATFNKDTTGACMTAQIFNGVNQTTPLGTAIGSPLTNVATTSLSLSVPSAATDLVVDGLFWYDVGGYYVNTPEQQQYVVAGPGSPTGNGGIRCSRKIAAGASTVMAWSRPNEVYSSIGVAIKGLGQPAFNLPDLRGRVTAGRDYPGLAGFSSVLHSADRLSSVSRRGATQGTSADYHYLYNIRPDLGSPPDICIGMYVNGPGITPGTYVVDFYDGTTLNISNPTTLVTSGTYTFYWLDPTKLGANAGENYHWLYQAEMPYHNHFSTGNLIGASGLAAGPHYNFNYSSWVLGTTAAGGNRSHNNLQPTIIINKIIKY